MCSWVLFAKLYLEILHHSSWTKLLCSFLVCILSLLDYATFIKIISNFYFSMLFSPLWLNSIWVKCLVELPVRLLDLEYFGRRLALWQLSLYFCDNLLIVYIFVRKLCQFVLSYKIIWFTHVFKIICVTWARYSFVIKKKLPVSVTTLSLYSLSLLI